MSDGPHRSLNMRRAWKSLAEIADTDAFSDEEAAQQLVKTLSCDWSEDIVPEWFKDLSRIMEGAAQQSLLGDDIRQDLERLKNEAIGRPLALTLMQCVQQILDQGLVGDEGVKAAAERALEMRIFKGSRQIEEHYCRKSTVNRANKVRARIEDALRKTNIPDLADSLVQSKPMSEINSVRKKDDIDEGVPL